MRLSSGSRLATLSAKKRSVPRLAMQEHKYANFSKFSFAADEIYLEPKNILKITRNLQQNPDLHGPYKIRMGAELQLIVNISIGIQQSIHIAS
jgi:hypothetical protein